MHARRRERIPAAADQAHRVPRRHGPPGARAAPRASAGESKLGKVYTFIGTKGGVGTTTLAVNFAAVLAQRKQSTVLIDLDWIGNDVAMQVGATPQYTLMEVAENLERMDQALFEGFVTRDPLGFFLVGPPDALEHTTAISANTCSASSRRSWWRSTTPS